MDEILTVHADGALEPGTCVINTIPLKILIDFTILDKHAQKYDELIGIEGVYISKNSQKLMYSDNVDNDMDR